MDLKDDEMDIKDDKSKDMMTSGSNIVKQTVFCQHNNFINLPFIEIRQNCQYILIIYMLFYIKLKMYAQIYLPFPSFIFPTIVFLVVVILWVAIYEWL